MRLVPITLILCAFAGATAAGKAPMDLKALESTIRTTWDFHLPTVSEQRFQAMADTLKADAPAALLVRTQIARAQGLQNRFDDANATDRKSTRLNSSHRSVSRMPSSA